jgi:hypothetical protein
LALSLHYLQEIAQLSDRASVERRFNVLEAFPSIRCKPGGSDVVLKLEEILDRIPDSDLAMMSVFFNSAREEVRKVLNRVEADPSVGEQLVRRLDPYSAPGFSLKSAVQRARKQHPKPDTAGDEIDVEHVGFAPCLDVLFVDKRTLGFVRQEARDHPSLLTSDATGVIERAGTLGRAAEVIVKQYGSG